MAVSLPIYHSQSIAIREEDDALRKMLSVRNSIDNEYGSRYGKGKKGMRRDMTKESGGNEPAGGIKEEF